MISQDIPSCETFSRDTFYVSDIILEGYIIGKLTYLHSKWWAYQVQYWYVGTNNDYIKSYVINKKQGSTESKPRGQLTLEDDLETKDVVDEANFMREI